MDPQRPPMPESIRRAVTDQVDVGRRALEQAQVEVQRTMRVVYEQLEVYPHQGLEAAIEGGSKATLKLLSAASDFAALAGAIREAVDRAYQREAKLAEEREAARQKDLFGVGAEKGPDDVPCPPEESARLARAVVDQATGTTSPPADTALQQLDGAAEALEDAATRSELAAEAEEEAAGLPLEHDAHPVGEFDAECRLCREARAAAVDERTPADDRRDQAEAPSANVGTTETSAAAATVRVPVMAPGGYGAVDMTADEFAERAAMPKSARRRRGRPA